jgi:Creatinase/Prolidase N-terminal domain
MLDDQAEQEGLPVPRKRAVYRLICDKRPNAASVRRRWTWSARLPNRQPRLGIGRSDRFMPGLEAVELLRARTADQGCAGLVVLNPVNLRYLTGYHSNAYSRPLALVLGVDGGMVMLVPRLEAAQARAITAVQDIRDYIEWDDGLARARVGRRKPSLSRYWPRYCVTSISSANDSP